MAASNQIELAYRILQICDMELHLCFPHLDSAMEHLTWQVQEEKEHHTDGQKLSFSLSRILETYGREPAQLRRGYLHMLLHCLFLHLFEKTENRLWDLACDVFVECVIRRQNTARLESENPIRDQCLDLLGEKEYSTQEILELLESGFFPYGEETLQKAFYFDDHGIWRKEADAERRCPWEQLLLTASGGRKGSGKRGTLPGSIEEMISIELDNCYDYRAFLQRFSFPREEVELDAESFDYVFYNFGMTHYGSMPLIEPLEYKEVRRLEELVIAIDTSHSCSVETVRRFLQETYEILSRQENFFRKMKVYFIQCDCVIQDVALILSREDWFSYTKNITIRGRSGTSFTPVFEYVEKLRKERELKNLKALLYFTDGDGAYPTQPPDYETAFVLLKESSRPELIPPWSKLLLI